MRVHKLSSLEIFALVLGSVIGWGAFTLPGSHFLPQSGLQSTLIGFAIGVIAIHFVLIAYLEMIQYLRHHKVDGGEFSYVYARLGKTHGFIVGWGLALCYIALVPLNATAFVLVVKLLFGSQASFFPLYAVAGYTVYLSDIMIAYLAILFFAWLNIRGIKSSARVQKILSASLVFVMLGLFIILGLKSDHHAFVSTYILNDTPTWQGVAQVVSVAPFLFVGFDLIPQVITHLGFSQRKITQVASVGVVVGALCYALLTTMVAFYYGPEEAIQKSWALGSAVLASTGRLGFLCLLVALAAAVSGGMNGFMIGASKLLAAMAHENMLPSLLGKNNSVGSPQGAILFVTLVSLIAPWAGREVIGYIVDMCSVSAALAYAYVAFIAQREARDLRIKLACKIGFILSCGFLLLLLVPFSPAYLSLSARIALVVWIILGVFYYAYDRKKRT